MAFMKKEFLISANTKEKGEILNEIQEELINTLDEIYQPLLKRYDEAYLDYSGAQAESYYVEGFIDGYRYLKSYIEYNKGAVQEWIKL